MTSCEISDHSAFQPQTVRVVKDKQDWVEEGKGWHIASNVVYLITLNTETNILEEHFVKLLPNEFPHEALARFYEEHPHLGGPKMRFDSTVTGKPKLIIHYSKPKT